MSGEEKQVEIKKGYTPPEPPTKPEEVIEEAYVPPSPPAKPDREPPKEPLKKKD